MLSAMSDTAVDESEDVKAGFAGLMSKAAEQAAEPEGEAPFGYTTDPDGTRRPKKAAGRPRKSPTLDELKAAKAETAEAAPRAEDRAPDSRRRPGRSRGSAEPKKPEPVVQFREGVIAKGMNKLYRKAGKMLKVWDADVGQAFIDITRKDDDDDITVGEAYEEIARTNPRVRKFLMRMIAGGAVGQLFMCHAPIGMALFIKFRLGEKLPMGRVAEAFLTPDEDGEAPADGTPAEGLTMPDMNQMMAMAQQFAEQAFNGRAASAPPRTPEGPAMPDPPQSPVGPGVTAAVPAASGS
jgi:hypothetical protein